MTQSLHIVPAAGDDPSAVAAVWSGQCRLLGWEREVVVARRANGVAPSDAVIAHAGGRQVRGSVLEWHGPGAKRTWQLPFEIGARRSGAGEAWATLDGVPIVSARRRGGAPVLVVGLDPADARAEPEIGAVLRRVLIAAAPAAAWLDLRGIVALRMDDPGASASVHLDSWSFEKIGPGDWEELGGVLSRRNARMTIAYTPGWVDDGDPLRGELVVAGMRVRRTPGQVHPSPLVRYRGRDRPSGDYEGEYRAVSELRDRGLCSVELHGYTHVHPETDRWAAAPSKHAKLGWYRELAAENSAAVSARSADAHPVGLGLELFRRHFGGMPTTLVCPGNAYGPDSLRRAHEAGFEAVAADRLAVRDDDRFAWLEIGAVALEHPAHRALDAELPAIACFHDRDLALSGVGWLREGLAAWRVAGASRFTDLRELVSALGLRLSVEPREGRWSLRVSRQRGPRLDRPFGVLVRMPGPTPSRLATTLPDGEVSLEVEPAHEGTARIELPAGV